MVEFVLVIWGPSVLDFCISCHSEAFSCGRGLEEVRGIEVDKGLHTLAKDWVERGTLLRRNMVDF